LAIVKHCGRQTLDATELWLKVICGDSKRIANADPLHKLNRIFHVWHGVELEPDACEPTRPILVGEFRRLAANTINQQLAAGYRLAHEAADTGC